jgi:hypothetical protein
VTNDIEILKQLAEIKKGISEVNQAIGKLTNLALANNSTSDAVGKQLVEDVMCPPVFPSGVCAGCDPESKCICNYGDREPLSG